MAGIITNNNSLKDLRVHAGKLASATESLSTLLEKEAIRLKRLDEVARLKALRAAIMRHMEEAKYDERIAGYSYSEGKYTLSIEGSVAGILGDIFNAGWLKSTSQNLAKLIAGGEPTFGTVLVRIGLGGVPDDVHVVSISELARESYRKEADVIGQMRKAKNELLTENDFTAFMAWLAQEIMAGWQSLPFKPEITPQIQVSRPPNLPKQNQG